MEQVLTFIVTENVFTRPIEKYAVFTKNKKNGKYFGRETGHSGYWDPGAIYHEFGHALFHRIWEQNTHIKIMDMDGINEGFVDFIACVTMKERGLLITPGVCAIASYYEL